MARPRNDGTMTIAALEQMLLSKRRRLERLQKQRDRLQRRLQNLERKIAAIVGGSAGLRGSVGVAAAGTRVRNPKSLVATLEQVLREAGKPLAVGEILDRVRAAGYRSSSANFRALVNQTLIKEKRFSKVSRGVYQLKK